MASALGQQTRIFELDEAQRMLPLVRSIVKGMIDDHAERQRALERLDALDEQDPPARFRLSAEIDSLTEKLVEAANELQELGVEFKGIDLGLVDFPCRRDGELVYLCWRYGEERIGFWHPVDAGYAGRRPIEPD
jgi:hypothetical protein